MRSSNPSQHALDSGATVNDGVDVEGRRILAAKSPAPAEWTGEVVGTFILVFFGLGTVHVSVLIGGLVGLWDVAVVWGIAVGIAIYATSELSGAHLNPAITLALAVYRGFPWRKVATYVTAQVCGAFLAAALLYVLFAGLIVRFEQAHDIKRGAAGSERSAMIYGEYFPNPGLVGVSDGAAASLSLVQAMAAETLGTAVLAFIVFAATQPRAAGRPAKGLVSLLIGAGLVMIIAALAPLTQAGFNPARDFGPRLFSCLAGWGHVAIPGPRGGFFAVYALGPLMGGVIGGGVHHLLIEREFALPAPAPAGDRAKGDLDSAPAATP